MRLKSLNLTGFKTFASKTDFEFADEITVIVGPNGSGKSNIADAVRWVLGEQSYKLLRGKKTLDMIFSGSDQRSRAGMAAATITFDNEDGWLPIDFSEVSITRKAYRDGKNEYLINGQQVLLRDVYELLGQSGLADRTYTIIGQGLVDAVLSLKADERRSLFEEAAGIGLYRSRRMEAERRLEKTHRNLDRVMDILSELEPRLRSLQRQSKRAEQYEQVKSDLRVMLRDWYGFHWFRVQEELRIAKIREEEQKKSLQNARTEQAEYDRKLSENQNQVQALRSKLNSWHRELSRYHTNREEITRERARSDERLRSLSLRARELESEKIRLEEQLLTTQERIESARTHLDQVSLQLQDAKAKAGGLRTTLESLQSEKQELEQQLTAERENLDHLKNQKLSLQVRIEERQEQISRNQQQQENTQEQVASARKTLEDETIRLEKLAGEKKTISSRQSLLQTQIQEQREKISADVQQQTRIKEQISTSETRLSRMAAELEVLQQAEEKLIGYSKGAQVLLQGKQKGTLAGISGALSKFIQVPERFEIAVAAVLGDYLDAVIVADRSATNRALDILQKESARGVLLPLDRIRPPEQTGLQLQRPGVIGLASELVQGPAQLRPVIDLLLGSVLIVESSQDLDRVLRGQPSGTRAVTLRGEVFHVTGEIIAGSSGKTSTLSRARQKKSYLEHQKELENEINQLKQQLESLNSSLTTKENKLAELEQKQIEINQKAAEISTEYRQLELRQSQANQEMNWIEEKRQNLEGETRSAQDEIARLQGEIVTVKEKIDQSMERIQLSNNRLDQMNMDDEREQLAYWDQEIAVANRVAAEAENNLNQVQAAGDEIKTQLVRIEEQQMSLKDEKQGLSSKNHQLENNEQESQQAIQELRELIEKTEKDLTQKEADQRIVQENESRSRKTLNRAERYYAQAEVQLTRSRDKLESMQERIREDIGLVELDYQEDVSGPTPLPLTGYVEKLPVLEEISDNLGDTLQEKRAQLRRLGAINPEARKEFQDVNQRHQFMTEQLSDLRKAEADIKEVIAELEVVMEREFRKTFDAVAVQFKEIFSRLFGGGKGQLRLTDPEDLGESGVDIDVKLPGRRTQGLSLLSGGERSLIATALIFSLIKISPTPFCVLDEVDAMLDESNVARYRKLLRELSGETQFIVITHNRNTVEVADIIYGIIMSEDSSSQVLSLQLDQVDEVIES
jgi:chromosome segregation protein